MGEVPDSPAVLMVLYGVFVIVCWAHVLVVYRDPPWRDTWVFYVLPLLCLSSGSVSVYGFMTGSWLLGIGYGAWSGILAYVWWHDQRRRRRKIAERVLGRVVRTDAGLKVVPEAKA